MEGSANDPEGCEIITFLDEHAPQTRGLSPLQQTQLLAAGQLWQAERQSLANRPG